jgi:hypothetical protein
MAENFPPLSPQNEEAENEAGVRTSTPISGRSSSLVDYGNEEADNTNDESEVSGRSSSQ